MLLLFSLFPLTSSATTLAVPVAPYVVSQESCVHLDTMTVTPQPLQFATNQTPLNGDSRNYIPAHQQVLQARLTWHRGKGCGTATGYILMGLRLGVRCGQSSTIMRMMKDQPSPKVLTQPFPDRAIYPIEHIPENTPQQLDIYLWANCQSLPAYPYPFLYISQSSTVSPRNGAVFLVYDTSQPGPLPAYTPIALQTTPLRSCTSISYRGIFRNASSEP